MSSLVSYEPYVDECADVFVERLTELSRAGASVDTGHWFQNYAFDVIGMITYAKRLGFLDRGEDIGDIISALGGHLTYATLARVLGGEKGRGRAFILHFTQQLMAASGTSRPSASANGNDDDGDELAAPAVESFLSKFQSKNVAAPETFTPYHVLTGCAANMVAGSDTTAITLSAILYYLLRNLAQQMLCLQAVIKEALRIHPATGLPIERVVPPGGSTIAGFHFAAGFGLGSRPCIGRHISTLEIGKLVPRILRDFNFTLDGLAAGPTGGWETHNMWFVKPQDFWFTVTTE
ncbi:hypothetical protein SCUCBS95973_006266 [Sporothrix curviconia]|uniref:Cytochrome P450 n=1 Tax=Sporothrix curviconia TaxID=1260050 RepID=A0ABP0C416_9PEZI